MIQLHFDFILDPVHMVKVKRVTVKVVMSVSNALEVELSMSCH